MVPENIFSAMSSSRSNVVSPFFSRKFQGCSKVFQGNSMGISRKFQQCFKRFKKCLRKVSREFQGRLKGVSRHF